MKTFWISWYQPTEDYRPVYDPKKENEPFGHRYWCSGQRCSDDAWTMCAIVEAPGEMAAKSTIRRYWPEAKEWRFCEEKPMDFDPGDRFPENTTRRRAGGEVVTEHLTAAQFRAYCGLGGKRRRTKYGAVPVIDPETGQRIASKREMAMLRKLRAEADATGHVIAVQPRFSIEGGHYTADAVEIVPLLGNQVPKGTGWVGAWVRFWDAKGVATPASRKSIRQVRLRHGVHVRIE